MTTIANNEMLQWWLGISTAQIEFIMFFWRFFLALQYLAAIG